MISRPTRCILIDYPYMEEMDRSEIMITLQRGLGEPSSPHQQKNPRSQRAYINKGLYSSVSLVLFFSLLNNQHRIFSLLCLGLFTHNMTPPRDIASDASNSNNDVNRPREPIVSPYMPKYPDPMSNISNFKIIESTLRGMLCFILSLLIRTY